jgi:Na+/melibiose symporter-like transporter
MDKNNTSETWSQYRCIKQHQWNMITIQMYKFVHLYCDHVSLVFCPSVLWSCFTGVVLSICIVIMFLWCCFVHLYCDHVSDGQNTSETWSQYRCTKQHQWNMITIQMYKTTLVKHDHNTDGQKQHQCLYCDHVSLVFCPFVLWSSFSGVVLSICIVIMFHWCCKTTPVKHDHNTDVQYNTSETLSQYRCTKQHQWNMITIQVGCCFVHLYCDHVFLVLFCPSVLWSCFTGVA